MSVNLPRMDYYIGKSVLAAIFVVLLAFLGLMSLFAVLEELREDVLEWWCVGRCGCRGR